MPSVASISNGSSIATLSSEQTALLASFWYHLEPALDTILDAFYRQIERDPAAARILSGRPVGPLIETQKKYWRKLFLEGPTEEYRRSAIRVGQAHQRIGLGPELYIPAYNVVLDEMSALIQRTFRFRAKKRRKMLQAVQSALLMDMSLAMLNYADAQKGATSQAIADGFSDTLLDQTVELALGTNKAATSSLGMLTDLAQVDERAQQISSATEEVTASVGEINARAAGVGNIAENALSATRTGNEIVRAAVTKMDDIAQAVEKSADSVKGLDEASERIAEIVTSIEEIAQHTNLLALNATIEAARAGEAGKGFAVVAAEVKELSNQTEKATVDIRTRIDLLREEMGAIVTAMDGGVEAVRDGVSVMHDVTEHMDQIAERVEETRITMADVNGILQEQAKATEEVAAGISEIAKGTAGNRSAIGQVIAAMNLAEEQLVAQLKGIAEQNIPHKEIRLAKAHYAIWAKHLADMQAGVRTMTLSDIPPFEKSEFGTWFLRITRGNARTREGMRALGEVLVTFHKLAHQLITAHQSGSRSRAAELFDALHGCSAELHDMLATVEAQSSETRAA